MREIDFESSIRPDILQLHKLSNPAFSRLRKPNVVSVLRVVLPITMLVSSCTKASTSPSFGDQNLQPRIFLPIIIGKEGFKPGTPAEIIEWTEVPGKEGVYSIGLPEGKFRFTASAGMTYLKSSSCVRSVSIGSNGEFQLLPITDTSTDADHTPTAFASVFIETECSASLEFSSPTPPLAVSPQD